MPGTSFVPNTKHMYSNIEMVENPKKKAKRGPKEERLIITGDPQTALSKLLQPKPKKKKAKR